MKLRRGIIAGALALATLAAAGCSDRASYEEVLLYYKAGSLTAREFQQCIPGGTKGPGNVNDQVFSVPSTLRTWDIREDGSGDTTAPIDTGTKQSAVTTTDAAGKQTQELRPGPKVSTFATVKFYLNTNCGKDNEDAGSPIVRFFETIGSRGWGPKNEKMFGPTSNDFNADSWQSMLKSTIVTAEQKALAYGTRLYLADDLESNAHGERADLERRITPMFQQELNNALGGDFFCGADYRRNTEVQWTDLVQTGTDPKDGAPVIGEKPNHGLCPPVQISITDINYTDKGIADARAAVYRAEQEAKQKLISAQAELDRANLLGQAAANEAYVRYQEIQAQLAMAEACKANSNCTVIVAPPGTNVQVQQPVK